MKLIAANSLLLLVPDLKVYARAKYKKNNETYANPRHREEEPHNTNRYDRQDDN